MKSARKRVAFGFPTAFPFLQRLSRGITDYARQNCNWTLTRAPEMISPSIGWLRYWPGDGAFALVENPADAQVARALPFPVVNLSGDLADLGVPTVTVDYAAIGRLAAGHLLERHFRRFGYNGTRGLWFSEQPQAAFSEVIRRAGGQVEVLEMNDLFHPDNRWASQEVMLDKWLRRFRPPFAIFACSDLRAAMVNDACQRLGLRVPEDVALIGVDNDQVACELCQPPLSSVARNDWQVGWEAAALLDRLMRGASPALAAPLLVAPEGVVARRSTDTLAVEDVQVAELTHYVRSHLQEAFGVERLLERSKMSRRSLENRFQECLGRSPYTFILEERVERARKMLLAPDKQSLTAIATACGFSELRRFRIAFQNLAGTSPTEFRRRGNKETPAAPARKPSRPPGGPRT
jgi:LacI family transcriptional regulator